MLKFLEKGRIISELRRTRTTMVLDNLSISDVENSFQGAPPSSRGDCPSELEVRRLRRVVLEALALIEQNADRERARDARERARDARERVRDARLSRLSREIAAERRDRRSEVSAAVP
jgi:hypothetical protein